MFLLTDNTLQVINFANKIDFDINKEIAEAAKGIKAIFHSACCADIPQEAMLEELTVIIATTNVGHLQRYHTDTKHWEDKFWSTNKY